MIKPINITPLDTSTTLSFKCEKCGMEGTITLTNYIVDVDSKGNPEEELDYNCFKCGEKL